MKQNPKYQQLVFPFDVDWSLTKNGVENIKRMAKELSDDIDEKVLNKLIDEHTRSKRNN
jgi:hypothetical protein